MSCIGFSTQPPRYSDHDQIAPERHLPRGATCEYLRRTAVYYPKYLASDMHMPVIGFHDDGETLRRIYRPN